MSRRSPLQLLALLVAAGLLAFGCSSSESDPGAGPRTRATGCSGVAYDDVRGPRPTYADDTLDSFPGSDTMCSGYWVPGANRRFVPQALALDGHTVWVSGYRYNWTVGDRQCVLTRIDQRTGRRLASVTPIEGAVPGRNVNFCRHGGGLARTDEGIWVAETQRLWLLDPDLVGTDADPVLRVWGLADPIRGSTLIDGPGRLGFGQFLFDGRPGPIDWFRTFDIVRAGVVELVADTPGTGQAGVVGRDRGIAFLQGGALGPGGLYLTQSNTRCGVLRLPGGRRVGIGPGTEDIEFDGGSVWAISESGARTYQHKGARPLVPMLARFDADRLLDGPRPTCRV